MITTNLQLLDKTFEYWSVIIIAVSLHNFTLRVLISAVSAIPFEEKSGAQLYYPDVALLHCKVVFEEQKANILYL